MREHMRRYDADMSSPVSTETVLCSVYCTEMKLIKKTGYSSSQSATAFIPNLVTVPKAQTEQAAACLGTNLRQAKVMQARVRNNCMVKMASEAQPLQTCVRCGARFREAENVAGSCRFHGDVLGNVLQLNWYEDHHYDDARLDNVKGPRYGRRWACCQDTDPDAPPCKSGFHVTYDSSSDRWREGLQFEVR